MQRRLYCLLIALLACTGNLWAQPEYDIQTAKEKWAYTNDLEDAGEYEKAVKPLSWLLQNAPDLSSALYIQGVKTYKGLEKQIEDPKRKQTVQDSVLLLYDLRMKYFQDSANVMNRKGLRAWYYWKDREDKIDDLYKLYKRAFALNGKDIYAYNTMFYMDIACKMKEQGKISNERVLQHYGKLNAIIEHNLNNADKTESWEKAKEYTQQYLTSCTDLSCSDLHELFAPKFKQEPTVKTARSAFYLLFKEDCYEDSLLLSTGKYLIQHNPGFGIAKTLARIHKSNKDLDGSLKYYKKALELVENDTEKGEVYMDIAQIYSRLGQKSNARNYARKAITLGQEQAAAYNLIGNLYFGSYKSCKTDDVVKSRAVYIAAYEMFKKAGNNQAMQQARAQFPSMSEIHTYGHKLGESLNTGCWIQEDVTLQKRPQ